MLSTEAWSLRLGCANRHLETSNHCPLKSGRKTDTVGRFSSSLREILRIIAGKDRGRKLKSPPSLETRPTSDRLRETLFNILAPRIKGARFLDLCAGSGAVGIEALSRDAAHATFVDQSRRMCGLIEANLEEFAIDENDAEVVNDETS